MSETTTPAAGSNLQFSIDVNQLKADLQVDITNLSDAMMRQPSLFAHYAGNTVRAKHQFEKMKRAMELLEAELDKNYRHTLKELNPKTTEPEIAAAIKGDIKWKRLSSAVLDAQQIYKMAEVAERSIDQKRELLLQIAKDAARESAGPLRVAANQTARAKLLDAMNGAEKGMTAAASQAS